MLRRDKPHIQENWIKDERATANRVRMRVDWEEAEIAFAEDEGEEDWEDEVH